MPATILVVDDDAAVVRPLARFLELEGFTPVTATNGQRRSATCAAAAVRPSSSWTCGCRSWTAAFRREQLRDPALAQIPVVVLTGADEDRLPEILAAAAFQTVSPRRRDGGGSPTLPWVSLCFSGSMPAARPRGRRRFTRGTRDRFFARARSGLCGMQRPRDVRRDHLQQPPAILIAAALGAVNAENPHQGRAKQKWHAGASLQIRFAGRRTRPHRAQRLNRSPPDRLLPPSQSTARQSQPCQGGEGDERDGQANSEGTPVCESSSATLR